MWITCLLLQDYTFTCFHSFFFKRQFPFNFPCDPFFPSIILNLVYLISSVWWSRWSSDANHGTSGAACTHLHGTSQSCNGSKQSPWEWPWLISCQLSRQWVIQFSLIESYVIFPRLFICSVSGFTVGECIKAWTDILSALLSIAPWKISSYYVIVSQALPMPFFI